MKKSEYAKAGVDYQKIEQFKDRMIETAKRTVTFPNRRGVYVDTDVMHSHGGVYEYRDPVKHAWCKTQEGLGNKNWISELLYANDPHGPTYHDDIAFCTAMMAANDNIAQGALPVTYTDEVIADRDDWFMDKKRSADFARGTFEACEAAGMALVAGESPVYKYLVNPRMPVKTAAVFGGCVTGIIAPIGRKITGKNLRAGSRIMAVASTGLHANGISLLIRRVMGDNDIKGLSNGFDTKLPSGMTIGQAAHIRTACYVPLVERLLEREIPIDAILPGTGDGVGKLGFDKRNYRCRIYPDKWLEVPELFLFMREIGVTIEDCLKTFNWGAGYYLFAQQQHVDDILQAAADTGFKAAEVGIVEEGERCTVFGPEGNLILAPPGE